MYFNPCKAVDVIMSLEQIQWYSGVTSVWPDAEEIWDTIGAIMNDCDTTTIRENWGGSKTILVDSGVRTYNVSANRDGQYPEPEGFHTFKAIKDKDGLEDCTLWDQPPA